MLEILVSWSDLAPAHLLVVLCTNFVIIGCNVLLRYVINCCNNVSIIIDLIANLDMFFCYQVLLCMMEMLEFFLICQDTVFCHQGLLCRLDVLDCSCQDMFFCYQDLLYRLDTLDFCCQATVFCYQDLLYKRDTLGL